MWNIWGPATEIKHLGVVAERCPFCERIVPCNVRAVCQGDYVFFLKVAATTEKTSCTCQVCAGSFPCMLWCYPDLVPAQEASAVSVDDLLARTNPGLAERVQLKEQVSALGGDARFTTAYEQLDGMPAGELHAGLLKELLDWGRLKDEQRDRLVQRIGSCARAWQFAREMAPEFPGHGCLPPLLAALVVWSALLWEPAARGRLWGAITVVAAGCVAAALISHVLLARRVRRWAREVLVFEAQRANVSLPCFLAVVDDLSGTRFHVLDDLWPVKDQIERIRGVLVADRRL
jgi:hypothetical protein